MSDVEAETYRKGLQESRREREEDAEINRAAREFKKKTHEAAGAYSGTQQDKHSDFGETVRAATKQFDDTNAKRVSEVPKQVSNIASPPSYAPKGPSKQELKDLREHEARAAKLREAEENAKSVRIAQEDAEKTKQFREMAARNEQRIKVTEAEQSALLKAKTGRERIAIRQQIEARQRAENERISNANAGRTQQVSGMRPITAGTIKESLKKSARNAPSYADKAVTGIFGGITEQITTPQKPKQTQKLFVQESKQLSRAIGTHSKMPVSGPMKQTPVVGPNAIIANPNFVGSLMGSSPMTNPKAKKGKSQQQSGGLLSGLNNFARRL
jgi:VIT1/CCC1 family predicted Fe2+/Mn2+ transporter